jgi:hypothetical protein
MKICDIGSLATAILLLGAASLPTPVGATDNTIGQLACGAGEVPVFNGVIWVCSDIPPSVTDLETALSDESSAREAGDAVLAAEIDALESDVDGFTTLGSLSCADGQIAKFNGGAWVCAADEDTANTDTLADLACEQDEIARYDGTQWVCADERPVRADGPCFSDTLNPDGQARYFDCGNGTVTDTVTGLILLQNADCDGLKGWAIANEWAAALGEGQCDLADGSTPGDWRLMTKEEWEAAIARAVGLDCVQPALTNRYGTGCFAGDPKPVFSGVQTTSYPSSAGRDR